MKMYNANGVRSKPLQVKLTKEEIESIVLTKYKKVNTHPKPRNRKRGN